jgi:tRNA(Ile2) C34 agmatinyltransferase TiaS
MTVIHKKCGTKLVSSGRGDFGVCPTCKIDVHHLIYDSGEIKFSKEVIISS